MIKHMSMVDERRSAEALAEVYRTEGVVQVPGLITADEVEQICTAFMSEVERDASWARDKGVPADDPLAQYPRFIHPHRHEEMEAGRIARRLLTDERILSVVTALIGPALGAQSMFYFKPPGARGQALHQDNIFLRAHPETCLAAWIAIDHVDAENGGLMVVPGSHVTEIVCPEEADLAESFTPDQVPIPEGMHTVQTRMAPGDVLFFHGSVVHGSRPNSSDRFRRSLIFHYVPQTSTEVASFYFPLVHPEHQQVEGIGVATGGGPCGEFGEMAH